jgi:hypothetical protein
MDCIVEAIRQQPRFGLPIGFEQSGGRGKSHALVGVDHQRALSGIVARDLIDVSKGREHLQMLGARILRERGSRVIPPLWGEVAASQKYRLADKHALLVAKTLGNAV